MNFVCRKDAPMAKRESLGEFEHLVLLAIIRQDSGGFGLTIRDDIAERTGRDIATGAVYTTLDRLEHKGFVRSHIEQGTVERDNRRRRRYTITKSGLGAVNDTQSALAQMSRGLRLAWSEK
jgi:PadR family transcriptional regulator PadR